jgi:hypothetical protein
MSVPQVYRVANSAATNLGFFCPKARVHGNWGVLLRPCQPFGENGWSGDGPRLSACCRAAHSTETESCLFPACTRDKDSPTLWLLPCRTCLRLTTTRECCPTCFYINCSACLNTVSEHQSCEACKGGRVRMTPEKILDEAKRCGLMCKNFGCINILIFEDEKDSYYKVWAWRQELKYSLLRGPAYALPDGTSTNLIVPKMSTATSSPGELATINLYIDTKLIHHEGERCSWDGPHTPQGPGNPCGPSTPSSSRGTPPYHLSGCPPGTRWLTSRSRRICLPRIQR